VRLSEVFRAANTPAAMHPKPADQYETQRHAPPRGGIRPRVGSDVTAARQYDAQRNGQDAHFEEYDRFCHGLADNRAASQMSRVQKR
jgi:hypothetical protein